MCVPGVGLGLLGCKYDDGDFLGHLRAIVGNAVFFSRSYLKHN